MRLKLIHRLSFLLVVSILFFTCSENEKEKNCSKPSKEFITHTPSEMSILMNEMYLVSDSVKQTLEINSSITIDYDQNSLLTAKSVNERVETKEFEVMAKSYLSLLKDFNDSRKNRIEKFNNMIDGCMNCHEQICYGPTARIKKLYIK